MTPMLMTKTLTRTEKLISQKSQLWLVRGKLSRSLSISKGNVFFFIAFYDLFSYFVG